MESSKPQSKRHWLWTLLVYCAAIGIFLLYGNLETSRSIYDDDFNLTSIERLNPLVRNFVGWSAFIAWLLLLAMSSVSFKKGWLRWPAVGLLLGFVFYPYCVLRHTLTNLAPWTIHGQVTTDEGQIFVFCDSSFLQGQTMAIAQEKDSDYLKTSYSVLVDNNGDSPRSWASVIRPEGSADGYGQLYLNSDTLIGVRYGNRCYMAFDLKSNRAYGHEVVESLSPFICLSDSDQPSSSDTQRTIDRIQEYADFCATTEDVRLASGFLNGETLPGCPPSESVQRGLEHGNTIVAAIAKQFGDTYSDANARLRARVDRYVVEQINKLSSSIAKERRNACEALGGLRQSASAAVPHLERLVRTENDDGTRIQASQTLGLIGEDAVPTLIALAKSDDSAVRSDALFGLSAAGTSANSPNVIRFLRSKMDDARSENHARINRLLQSLQLQSDSATEQNIAPESRSRAD